MGDPQAQPKLAAELTEFYAYHAKHQGGIPKLQSQYMARVKALKNATATDDYKRFVELTEYFGKYGKRYNFEPLMLAAQGYQESTLNQEAKSPVGAIGVMQVMPATGEEPRSRGARAVSPRRADGIAGRHRTVAGRPPANRHGSDGIPASGADAGLRQAAPLAKVRPLARERR